MPSGKFINLRANAFNDSDLMIDTLGKKGERFSLTAKNALKSQRRFGGGVLEPLNFVEFFYTRARSGYLYLQEARLIDGFCGLRQDYHKLEVGFHFLKLITGGCREGLSDNSSLFDLLGNGLKALEFSQSSEILKLHFEVKYLYYLGFLSLDSDTREFVARPLNQYQQIRTTREELFRINQIISDQLKRVLEHSSHIFQGRLQPTESVSKNPLIG